MDKGRSWPGNAATEEAAVETVPAKEEEDGPLGDWIKEGAGRGMQQLKRQLLKQFQPKRRRMALLEIGQRRCWPGNAATEGAAVETGPAEEEEDGPLGDWIKEGAGRGMQQLKRQLLKQFQPKRRRMALLEIG